MTEVCANCDCVLAEDCCGSSGPFSLDDIDYCCRACAEDGECTCGCTTAATALGNTAGGSVTPGPIF